MEHPKRSMMKSVSWRLFSYSLTVTIIYVYTKDIKSSLGVGAGIDIVKLVLYYCHERIWNRVKFGRQKPHDYQI